MNMQLRGGGAGDVCCGVYDTCYTTMAVEIG